MRRYYRKKGRRDAGPLGRGLCQPLRSVTEDSDQPELKIAKQAAEAASCQASRRPVLSRCFYTEGRHIRLAEDPNGIRGSGLSDAELAAARTKARVLRPQGRGEQGLDRASPGRPVSEHCWPRHGNPAIGSITDMVEWPTVGQTFYLPKRRFT
jgi:hypothetical protein